MTKQQQDAKRYEELKWKEAPLDPFATGLESEDASNGEPKRLPLHAETTALLVVDVQPEYWSGCPSVRKDFPVFPERLAKTVEICRQRQAKIIWVRADYRRNHSPWLVQFERLRGKTPGFMVEVPCDPTAPEFHWEDFATPTGNEVIIPKSSWSSTSDTALLEVLRVSGIDTVLVCGLITSVCVQHSAFGVFEAGFRTLLVTDACGDRGRARHEAALALYGDYMYELVTSKDLDENLATAKPRWLTLNSIRRSPLNSFQDLQSALPKDKESSASGDSSTAALSTSTSSGNLSNM
uniref:Isochorismatase-like domain-containing protein n=1 Tax=Amphora coffeiformis TaxID=265554 RepID=A0A7S3L5G9_9STRA|mmetsp:Transcript_14604/g.27719  ORF Transcript_14604/g.27719 Transcript_14604/m.27719 type:complete len:294 (-) Transcript_14604:141-1022(-)|eukprot:scaffold3676_cov166-Amphora_coffeaeformis.AAC.2